MALYPSEDDDLDFKNDLFFDSVENVENVPTQQSQMKQSKKIHSQIIPMQRKKKINHTTNLEACTNFEERMKRKKFFVNSHNAHLPPHLKVPVFDILIICSMLDLKKTEEYKEHLCKIKLESGRFIKAALHCDAEFLCLSGSTFQALQKSYEKHSVLVFVVMSSMLWEDTEFLNSAEGTLMKNLLEENNHRVFPVYFENPKKSPKNIHIGFASLNPQNYYQYMEGNCRDFYLRRLKGLISAHENHRHQLEENLLNEQYKEINRILEERKKNLSFSKADEYIFTSKTDQKVLLQESKCQEWEKNSAANGYNQSKNCSTNTSISSTCGGKHEFVIGKFTLNNYNFCEFKHTSKIENVGTMVNGDNNAMMEYT